MMGSPLSVFNLIHFTLLCETEIGHWSLRYCVQVIVSVHYIQLNGVNLSTTFTPFNSPWKCSSSLEAITFFVSLSSIQYILTTRAQFSSGWKLVWFSFAFAPYLNVSANRMHKTEQNNNKNVLRVELLSVDSTESIYRWRICTLFERCACCWYY